MTAERYESVGVVDEDALDMVDGVVVEHPQNPGQWIVARPEADE